MILANARAPAAKSARICGRRTDASVSSILLRTPSADQVSTPTRATTRSPSERVASTMTLPPSECPISTIRRNANASATAAMS